MKSEENSAKSKKGSDKTVLGLHDKVMVARGLQRWQEDESLAETRRNELTSTPLHHLPMPLRGRR